MTTQYAQGLFVLVPNTITDAMFVSSTVAEPDPNKVMPDGAVGEVAWSVTNHAAGKRVVRATTHSRYRANQAVANTVTTPPENDLVNWTREAPTNKWAAFDDQANTKVTAPSGYSILLQPGTFTDVEFFALDNVDEIAIQILDEPGGNVVYSQVLATDEFLGADPHWAFYFAGPVQGSSLSVAGLEPYPDAEVTITFTSYDAQPLAVGVIAFGSYEFLGFAQYGFSAVRRNFGWSDNDKYGNTIDYPGLKGKDLKGTALVDDVYQVNGIDALLERLLDVNAVYVPSLQPEYRYLKTYGRIKPASIEAAGVSHALVTIEIEGRI